ncbi:unnamed protein product [Polarella glacialis]|uniref:Uncharacterized protein n=1 Tax=Polarella glacialis TaxID=89957 RepID=A0A813HTB6_POLGL|nr:unnamed protein product [Polarella glacialis]
MVPVQVRNAEDFKAALSGNAVTHVCFPRQANCAALVAEVAGALKVNATLTSLSFGDFNGIGTAGAAALAEALKVDATLTSLSFGQCNCIGPQGAVALAEALKVNGTLTSLSFGGLQLYRH